MQMLKVISIDSAFTFCFSLGIYKVPQDVRVETSPHERARAELEELLQISSVMQQLSHAGGFVNSWQGKHHSSEF